MQASAQRRSGSILRHRLPGLQRRGPRHDTRESALQVRYLYGLRAARGILRSARDAERVYHPAGDRLLQRRRGERSQRLAHRNPLANARGSDRSGLYFSIASTSTRQGAEDCAPILVTEIAAAALAKRSAAGIALPSASATASAALNVSPAAVVSRASTGNAG